MKKLLFVSCCFIGALVSIAQNRPDSTKGIFIKPATVNFELAKGQTMDRSITIANNLNKKMQFSLYLNDWNRDSVGGHNYFPAGTSARSCARWVSLEKNFIELNAGESASINLKMHVPDSADAVKEMKWAMLFVESINERSVPQSTGVSTIIKNKVRIGIHIYQTPGMLSNKDVKMVSFAPLKNSNDSLYQMVCKNTGDVQLRCRSYVELSNISDNKKTKLTEVEFPLFPGQARALNFAIPKALPKGKYTMIGAVDGGDDIPLEAAQLMVEIK